MGNSSAPQFDSLSAQKLEVNEEAKKQKDNISSKKQADMKLAIFSQTEQQRQQLWKAIGGLDGAHQLSFHFYRRIYDNDNNSEQKEDTDIETFCTLFTVRPFHQAVDRVVRFMSSELAGEKTFWSISWINTMHCTHTHANEMLSPRFGQMWFSFLCAALTDLDWNKQTKKDILTFFKDCLAFLFMDTWKDCKQQLAEMPVKGLVKSDDQKRIAYWSSVYKQQTNVSKK